MEKVVVSGIEDCNSTGDIMSGMKYSYNRSRPSIDIKFLQWPFLLYKFFYLYNIIRKEQLHGLHYNKVLVWL